MTPEINYKKTGKITNMEIKQHTTGSKKNSETKNYIEKTKMEIYQNLWDVKKIVLRGMLRVINAYLQKQTNKQTKSQINNLCLKELEKEEQSPKLVEEGNDKD